jgi:uncharacterized membrane protein YczE
MSTTGIARVGLLVVLGVLTIQSLRSRPIPVHEQRARLPRCVAGLVCFGVGISCFFASRLGVPPWDVLHGGIARLADLDVGLVINLVGLVVLPLWIPLRERVGLGTVLNTLIIGFVVSGVNPHLPIGSTADTLIGRIAYAVAGLVIIALGSGLYIGSGLGAGPRDGIMMGLSRLGLSVRAARTCIEATTLVIGFLLGGSVGAGTVLFMVGIGPLVQVFLPRLRLPALHDRAVPAGPPVSSDVALGGTVVS